MFLSLIDRLFQFQIAVFSGSVTAAIIAVAVFDSLFAYAIIRAGSERKSVRNELVWLIAATIIVTWLALQLTEKAGMMPYFTGNQL